MKNLILDLTPPLILRWYNNVKGNQNRYLKRNIQTLNNFPLEFEVLEFSYIDKNFRFDYQWGWWSRIYEYPLVLEKMRNLGWNSSSNVHNTCWGSQGCHILFKDQLETGSGFVVNSDINHSELPNTSVYDLTKTPSVEYQNNFDFVLNVSTLEEIQYPHLLVFQNLLSMVKPGGYLIATFDIPGLDLGMFEKLFGRKISEVPERLNGGNSPYLMTQYSHLEVGYMVIKRT